MNLIEELGLEKCKQIVDGAPEGLTHFKLLLGVSIYYQLSSNDDADLAGLWIDDGDDSYWGLSSYKNFELFMPENRFISIEDLRTAIANHDQYWYGQSEEKELEQYAILSQEKIEGGAVLVGDNSAIVQAMRNITDDCTDIRNHISPLTGVIER